MAEDELPQRELFNVKAEDNRKFVCECERKFEERIAIEEHYKDCIKMQQRYSDIFEMTEKFLKVNKLNQ